MTDPRILDGTIRGYSEPLPCYWAPTANDFSGAVSVSCMATTCLMPETGLQYNGLAQREEPMAETIRRVDYFYVTAPNKPGEGVPDVKHASRSGH